MAGGHECLFPSVSLPTQIPVCLAWTSLMRICCGGRLQDQLIAIFLPKNPILCSLPSHIPKWLGAARRGVACEPCAVSGLWSGIVFLQPPGRVRFWRDAAGIQCKTNVSPGERLNHSHASSKGAGAQLARYQPTVCALWETPGSSQMLLMPPFCKNMCQLCKVW